jgi:aminomethyltransferase
MERKTALYEAHTAAGGKIVDFFGWQLPMHYGSQLSEHHAVRRSVGMFDVSHMTVVDITGTDAAAWLAVVLANNVQKIGAGQALYSLILNHQAGILDDCIVYARADKGYRLVFNAATFEQVSAWLQQQALSMSVQLTWRDDVSMLAVQGPEAMAVLASVFPQHAIALASLKPFLFIEDDAHFIATTGYTGEAGVEIILSHASAVTLWQALLAAGVQPCGLGARDTLRLEAGFNLSGQDMDASTNPWMANVGWTIAWQPESRQFIGKEALLSLEQTEQVPLVGLIMTEKGVLRGDMSVYLMQGDQQVGQGTITSGGFSPTLGHAIAFARLPKVAGARAEVRIRNRALPVTITQPVFVRRGQAVHQPTT